MFYCTVFMMYCTVFTVIMMDYCTAVYFVGYLTG